MKFLDLFAGLGGIRLGFEQAGHECVGFCEFDKFAVASYTSMHLITDEQREYLATLPLKERQKEILKDEYRNGEWFCGDIRTAKADDIPAADCWCFGAPCQDFSVAGQRKGLSGDRSSLIREVFRLLEETPEEKRPEWLFYENVKGMFSTNKGFDFLAILIEMESLGYDAEWQLINSKYFVPQNRERVYTLGHSRRFGPAKVFPLQGTDGEDCLEINVIGSTREPVGYGADRKRVLDPDGVAPTIRSTDSKEPYKVGIPIGVIHHKGKSVPVEPLDTVPTLTSEHRFHQPEIVIPVDVSTQDVHPGMYVELEGGITAYAVWYEKEQCYIVVRRLTPREYFRLQGIPDDMFDRAQFVNSDNQLYRQAGNSVSVPVICEIARKMGEKH